MANDNALADRMDRLGDELIAKEFVVLGMNCKEAATALRSQQAAGVQALGMNIVVDPTMPPDQMEIRSGKSAVRVTNIGASPAPAVPQGWIACSERVPFDEGHYIVFSKGFAVGYAIYNFTKGWRDAWGYEPLEDEITHWMPLPASPREGGK